MLPILVGDDDVFLSLSILQYAQKVFRVTSEETATGTKEDSKNRK